MKKWLPKDEWNKISLEQQKDHLNKFRRSINYNFNNNSEMPQDAQQKPLPSQYNTVNSFMTDKESKLYNFKKYKIHNPQPILQSPICPLTNKTF